MDRSSRNDFNIVAIPPPALALRLANLVEASAGAFITGFGRNGESERRHRERERERDDEFLAMVQAVYEATQARILDMFDIDDRASRLAIAEIDEELARNAQQRQDMIDRAVKLDDGDAVFLSADGVDIYRENGQRLDEKKRDDLLDRSRPELEQATRWEAYRQNIEQNNALVAERADIVKSAEERDRLRKEVESGRLDQDELEALEARYDRDVPERVRRYRDAAQASDPALDGTLSADETASALRGAADPRLSSPFNLAADPVLADEPPLVAPTLPAAQRDRASATPVPGR